MIDFEALVRHGVGWIAAGPTTIDRDLVQRRARDRARRRGLRIRTSSYWDWTRLPAHWVVVVEVIR